ncbi:aminopeptidase N [Mangrovicoccus algicola]|uniref:Aminopeptidase N n=1 Tax=Mangrovicoccus algicola TaxID=2771008 RepID=A0A8J6YXF1_9RHOB|nr:aminopeptidase N [Mangrovicoccus algicola]MBE3639457.1 aminopeptidase N [Mangrovicoccus algicola]
MRDASPQSAAETVHLKDYAPFGYLIDKVELVFRLDPEATRVTSRIAFRPDPAAKSRDFFLHGEKLKLIGARIDGQKAAPEMVKGGLRCTVPDAPFLWEAEVEIAPAQNTALDGLYMSNGMYCTQCEAEGFRKITYYPDRPDVMAPFSVRIEGTQPVLLSNGNPGRKGEGFAEWHDPWKKPAYLFALVAGDLVCHSDSFTTRSGRRVALGIWVRAGDLEKCGFAMDALKRAMAWDERVYGREYDLDVFNIVAVDDFNMGAMENKGLNIFNSSAVLASPETATDANYERIESIIAHEYFHNWTGNRITCRDWFQLCLKEGLTVFRDQQFSADERSAPVQRINDVLALRGRQFREDNGPLAHPVRPESFVEINNFYTATVYEKGAELIGMLRRLVGEDGYARALDLYFRRHDGQACTIEDWLKVFEDACDRDLGQFKLWYAQAGTPRLGVEEAWDGSTFTLTLTQKTPPTPGQAQKAPLVIPVATGLLAPDGSELVPTRILEMTEARQSFRFADLPVRPVASVLRGFSAPVILERRADPRQLRLLLAHDTDPFNRWEAGRLLARNSLLAMLRDGADPDAGYFAALNDLAGELELDPAFRALCLALPGQDDIAQALHDGGTVPDPVAIYRARRSFAEAMARALQPRLAALYEYSRPEGPYSPDAGAAGRRALAGAALGLLTLVDGGGRARRQYAAADNMTEQLGALSALVSIGEAEEELAQFYAQWKDDRLVLDKWFGLQVGLAGPETAVATARTLSEHPDFSWKTPNRFRAVIGGFAANPAGFHDPSGAGYGLVADWLIRLDPVNPQTTARMSTAFETWRRYDADRRAQMREALERMLATKGLSRDTTEMITRMLG